MILSRIERATKKVQNKDSEVLILGDLIMEDMGSEKEFFKEKFMANVAHKMEDATRLLDYDDFELLEGDVKVSTDGPYPKIFSEHVHEILDKSIEQIVVVKLFGRTTCYKDLINRIQALWKLIWDFQVIDIENDY
ncbi:hypothetical protein PVK06_028291 [Gossypium arboreum]|uniref:Uncharacterized protein n=1 Tax=Gossypium arboreum TaxID=29729 RepID=A0ABR0P2K5_GOSAR|nr:hypothetical protein PVK06_028291 [Gossypium arboreum]